MHFTEMSGIMAFLWSSVFILLIYYIRKKEVCFQRSEMICIVFLYIFSAVRLTLSIDFIPSVGIDMPKSLSIIVENVFWIKRKFGGMTFTISQMFLIVWGLTAAVKLLRYIKRYHKLTLWLYSFQFYKEGEEGLEKVQTYLKKKIKVDIRKSADVSAPVGFGIFHKIIVLPERIYEDDELFYILLHECQHFLNHDCMVKTLMEIYQCIFWWNPFTRYLRKDLERHQEICCDLSVVKKMSIAEVKKYLQTIINVLQKSDKGVKDYVGTVSLAGSVECELTERFTIIVENQKRKKSHKKAVIYTGVFAALFIFSYSFMLRPAFDAPLEEIETEPGVYDVNPDNAYICIDKDGTYKLIREGVVEEILDQEDLKIFQESGFIIKEEKN